MSAKLIRAWLRTQPDGATQQQIGDALGINPENVNESLRRAPDIYIDRWLGPRTRVWIAVHVPEDCPPPAKRKATA